MTEFYEKISQTIGLPPGITPDSEKPSKAPLVTLFDYDSKSYEEKIIHDVKECLPLKESLIMQPLPCSALHMM